MTFVYYNFPFNKIQQESYPQGTSQYPALQGAALYPAGSPSIKPPRIRAAGLSYSALVAPHILSPCFRLPEPKLLKRISPGTE